MCEAGWLLALLRAALDGNIPPEKPEDADFEAAFRLAVFHGVANTAFYAVERLQGQPEPELMKKWKQTRDRAIVKDLVQREELEKISKALSEAGIRHVPLKGAVLKEYYPQSDMRGMSDLDLLIDEKNAEVAGKIMLSLGYREERLGEDIEDIYFKEPYMNVELHRSLILTGFSKDYDRAFSDPWSACAETPEMRKRFRDDYFFAYVLAHAMKHYENAGTGIRSFMDFYMFESRKPEAAKKALLFFQERKTAALARECMELSRCWFSGAEPEGKLRETADFVLSSGTYGTFENGVAYRLKSKGKAAYLLELLFPPPAMMKNYYPVLRRAPALLPFCWIARILTKPFTNRKQNLAKLKALKKR